MDKFLCINGNLKSLPKKIIEENLIYINVSNNKIRNINKLPQNLHTFVCIKNKIKKINCSINELNDLICYNNKIKYLNIKKLNNNIFLYNNKFEYKLKFYLKKKCIKCKTIKSIIERIIVFWKPHIIIDKTQLIFI